MVSLEGDTHIMNKSLVIYAADVDRLTAAVLCSGGSGYQCWDMSQPFFIHNALSRIVFTLSPILCWIICLFFFFFWFFFLNWVLCLEAHIHKNDILRLCALFVLLLTFADISLMVQEGCCSFVWVHGCGSLLKII